MLVEPNVSSGTFALEHVFGEEIEGSSSYAVGIWTRWVMTQTPRLVQKGPVHSIYRLASTREYHDRTITGDRTLAAWVVGRNYYFGTYDLITQNAMVSQLVPYENNLEGEWNYLYFCYK